MAHNGKQNSHMKKYKKFFHAILTHHRAPFGIVAIAVVLTLSSLNVGLIYDDYHHKLLMSGSQSPIRLLKSPIDMFNFFDGNPQRISELKNLGFLPWWTSENIKGAFWRPLTSLTHWLDYILWPNSPWLMHAQSILWYATLVMVIAFLYRRFSSTALIAGLAALLFAIDDAHGTPVGFLANRNVLIAAFFGVLTIIAYDRWRRYNWSPGMICVPLLLAASLLSAEAGLSTCAYLSAYALFIDKAKWKQRFACLIPCAAVVIIWRLLWTHLGYGFENAGVYIDPLGEPLEYIAAIKTRLPFLLLGQWLFPPSDIVLMLPPGPLMLIWRIALGFLIVLIFILMPLLLKDRTARFWATGMVLSTLPVCATFPNDRLLVFVGIGAMGLVAQLLSLLFDKSQPRPKQSYWRIPAMSLAVMLILSHFVIAPVVLPFRAANPMGPRKFMDRMMVGTLDESVRDKDLVIVNPPISFLAGINSLIWAANELPMPRHIRILTSSLFEPVEIHRPDANTLVVRPSYGYYAHTMDTLFRDKNAKFSIGDRVELTAMTVEITEITADGRPAQAAFIFSVPLEDPSLKWLQYIDQSFVPFTPPEIGTSATLPAPPSMWN